MDIHALTVLDRIVDFATTKQCACTGCKHARRYALDLEKNKVAALRKQLIESAKVDQVLAAATNGHAAEGWKDAKSKRLPQPKALKKQDLVLSMAKNNNVRKNELHTRALSLVPLRQIFCDRVRTDYKIIKRCYAKVGFFQCNRFCSETRHYYNVEVKCWLKWSNQCGLQKSGTQ